MCSSTHPMDYEKVFDRPQVTVDSTLTSLELQACHNEMKSIIWVLRIRSIFKHEDLMSFGTGFSIDSNGLIMTSSHILQNGSIISIHARRLNENDFPFECEIVSKKPKWDLALLQVKGVSDCSFGRFAADGSIFAGQNLLHVGHPANFVGSFLIGKAAFQCVNDVVLPTGTQICQNYQSTALHNTPRYRVMGDIWNIDDFKKHPSNVSFSFEKSLHPLIPVIQICGLVCGEGCSGGPVFNSKGEIVGMVALGANGFQIAIHVSLLKHFLKEREENMQSGNIKSGVASDDKGGRLKKFKGPA
ncbi:probable periplasmic serine endoprotease DegP-like isoform X1 [Ricinus communis]|uniref:probable periplasmic serine endoprotease DegP-like isoform X1 n=1 Tax=Ricinus communis TaxID=3988 RepID=UPI00201A7BBA|nr:probable periplasmic serine endoprotease DegP-like isoform X1 [Ricinus communis]